MLLLAAFIGRSQGGHAADPQPYAVTIKPTGKPALDKAAAESSTLVGLREQAPVGPFGLVERAQGDVARFTAALGSFGYYNGRVEVTIAGKALDDPGLADLLDATPATTTVPVQVTLTPGPEFHLRNISLGGAVAPEARAALDLQPGQPALASSVLAAQGRMLKALLDSGHALAKVDAPVATLEEGAHALDVSFHVDAGPRVDIGQISIAGLKDVNESFVRRRLLLRTGQQYNPDEIEKARQDVASEGVFSSVRITPSSALAPDGSLPVRVTVTERPLHVVNLGAAFSTDQGGSLNASWTDRNLFGNAEALTLSAAATQLGGSASRQPGYNVGAALTIPDWQHRAQTLGFNVNAIKEYLDAYNRTAFTAGTTLSRKFFDELTLSAGLTGEVAKITQERITRNYTLVQVPLSAQFDNTHDLFDPTHGYRASVTVTPTESLRSPQNTFVIVQASGSTYVNLGEPGRSVLALRALVGVIEGATTFQVPPDQRFFGGGGGTIRGYRFQSVGPQFADRRPLGGTSIDVGTVEFRQRFGASYGAVVFVDAGQVGSDGKPFSGKLRAGAGIGARYYTAIGPIRLDVAVPLVRQAKGDALEAYIGIGQAF